jgi:NodT family efflux transporter outer membrane factor (OMF) lipoprotein
MTPAATVLTAALAAALLGACRTVGPDFERPQVPWLAGWPGGSLAALASSSVEQGAAPAKPDAARGASLQTWWDNFHDPVLSQLIAGALRANPSVRTAGLRIMEARAQLGIAASTLYPQGQQVTAELLGVGAQRSGAPDSRDLAFDTGLRIGWELDFWGKFRRTIEAADAGYLASIARYDDVQVLIAAQVANLYCAVRTIEARLAIAVENADIQRRSLDITALLFKGGAEAELDVQQARALYLNTLSTIPQLESSLRQTQNALSILLARPPGPLPEMAPGRNRIPQATLDLAGLPAGRPADLLRRRPDVRGAEMQLAAQSALIGVSEADLYPAISLTGAASLSATSMSGAPQVLNWALGPSLVANVFDYGRLRNSVLLQDARFQQLAEQYQDAVLRAAREVDDAAVGFARTREQIALQAEAVKAARRSLDLATLQYREGLVDFQRVIDSQRTFFSQQDLLATSRGNLAQNLIALYKALGGGWEQGRTRPVLDEATRATMDKRSDWRGILAAPLPPPGAAAGPWPEPASHP